MSRGGEEGRIRGGGEGRGEEEKRGMRAGED